MERSLFKYILRYSKKEQITLLIVGLLSQPIYFLSLQMPKEIIDDGIKGSDFPRTYLGVEVDQIFYLLSLCCIFLVLVFINGGFKYFINVYRGASGERMLRRLRYQLVSRIMRFPLPYFRKTSQGEMVSMVTLETEPLGGFFGESLSLPVYQGGILLTLMIFMFVQDWILGLAAIALYPVQGYIIPKLQKRVNALGKQRVANVRQLTERIGETVEGAREIHANDTSQFELADFSSRLGKIYGIRYEIYRRKFFIKFVNNFLAQVTPFFFFSIGGVLVIQGSVTVGALVAILAAYKDVSGPWKMLLTYYQRLEDTKIKFAMIIEKFEPPGMFAESQMIEESKEDKSLSGQLTASNVSWVEDDGLKVVDGASLTIELPKHVLVEGSGGSGKGELAEMMARLVMPSGGRIQVGDENMAELSESVTGRQVSYVGPDSYLFAGTLLDSLFYGVKHRPMREAVYEGEDKRRKHEAHTESERSGNSVHDIDADWVDYELAGIDDPGNEEARIQQVLRLVALEEDVYQIGLRRTIDPKKNVELTEDVLAARVSLRQHLEDPDLARYVESFDKEKVNRNASIAENILFGTPVGEEFDIENLGENAYVLEVLERVDLKDEFLDKGHRLAETMVELFRDLPGDHEFFERFSFIGSDDLPDFETILRRSDRENLGEMNDEDKAQLIALPFKLIEARHHLGLIDEELDDRILAARREFAENLPENLRASVEFFDVEEYNSASSVQDNVLFGKRATEKAESAAKLGALVSEVIEKSGLRSRIIKLGLDSQIGLGGSRLSAEQKQKLAIARGLMKRPDLLILNSAMLSLDEDSQRELMAAIRAEQKDRSLILVPGQNEGEGEFDQVLTVESGRIVAKGDGSGDAAASASAPGESGDEFADEIEVLASMPLFAGLDRSRIKLLTLAAEHYDYDEGQMVFRQGDVGDNAFIILGGAVDVVIETAQGPQTVASMGKNELFGELALLCNAPRTATIVAKADLKVFSLNRDTFFKLIAEDADMSARIMRFIAQRLERTTRDLGSASSIHDGVTKLADMRLFKERLTYTVARAERYAEKSALICFDLEDALADVKGAEDGSRDLVLREVAARVTSCVRKSDTAARIGPSRVALIVNPINGDFGPEMLAQRIADRLGVPFSTGGDAFQLASSYDFWLHELDEAGPDDQLAQCMAGTPTRLQPAA